MTDEGGKRHRRREEEERRCLVQNRVTIRKAEDMIDEDGQAYSTGLKKRKTEYGTESNA